MPVFKRRIDAKIQKAMRSPRTEANITKKADLAVKRAKKMLFDDIDMDPVSIKINSDPETKGLYGFEPTETPVENLKGVINRRTELNRKPRKRVKNKKAEYTYNIKFPAARDIYSEPVLTLPWISKTWVEYVEKGISGVERFVFKRGKGRSEFGVQYRGNINNTVSPLQDNNYIKRIRGYFSENLRRTGL